MKNKGHTKTLFYRWGRYWWSYKHDYCIQCKTVKYKHKGNGLCTSCFDKKRLQSNKRIFNVRKQRLKFYFKKRVELFLNKKEKTKRGPQKTLTEEQKKEYKKNWREKNKTVLYSIAKANRMLKKGERCLKINIRGKEIPLPFSGIEKHSCRVRLDTEEYKEYKRRLEILKKVREFYNKTG